MNCSDCHHTGQDTAAIAVCHDCGAALCPDHTIESTHHLTATRALNRQAPVDPPERRVHCDTCAAAIAAAGKLSIGAVAKP